MKFRYFSAFFALLISISPLNIPAAVAESGFDTVPVKTIVLKKQLGEATRHYFGTVQGSQRVALSFRVPGPLIELPIELGAEVKKGDLIGRIDPRDFRTRLSAAKSKRSQAQAKYTSARNNFKRYEELYKKKVVSQSQYDRFRTAYDVALSNLKTAKAEVTQAENLLADTKLTAPFDGIIVSRMVENFQEVQATQPIALLQNIRNVEIVMNIPEEDAANISVADGKDSRIRLDENVTLDLSATLEAFPEKRFKVTFKEFGAQSNPRTRTYPVTVTMPQPDDVHILPGMMVNITAGILHKVPAPTKSNYYIPLEALVGDLAGNKWVWKCSPDGKSFKKTAVRTSNLKGDRICIEGDVRPGDIIITHGARNLEPWQNIHIIKK